MVSQNSVSCLLFFVFGFTYIEAQLMCWSCSSDLDIRCHDYFNTTKFDRYYQQNYQSGNYNPNNPQSNYPNRGYNQGYNQGIQSNPYQSRPTQPYMKNCPAISYGDKKSVCMKRVQTSNDGRTVTIRDCATVPTSQSLGKCPPESNSYIRVDFCEYCDQYGCNSGNHNLVNVVLPTLSLLLLFWSRS
ncbi:hypothetical protein WA026_010874 [Henosepilachna vigintioctopunctata]|uniref:Protein sleepless n=1 Tax=Henosepilachna vigintioctopunctata TaxID=420089 RepID=A0AAW1UZE5_9CUCU